MNSVATTSKTSSKAKRSLGYSFNILNSRLSNWVCRKCEIIGGLTFGLGILMKQKIIFTPMLASFPLLADVALMTGLILSILGIITKVPEVIKLFKNKDHK